MTTDSRTHTPTLDNDDLETILSIARNEQSGRITRRETEILVAAYRAHDGLVEALRKIEAKADAQAERYPRGSDGRNMCFMFAEFARRALEAAGITEGTDGR